MIYNSGSDWYTATNVLTDALLKEPLMSVFTDLSETNTRWSAGGYKGKQDINGHLKYGSRSREDGAVDELLISSAEQSDITIAAISDTHLYKCTRLDLQVTVQLDQPDPKLSSEMYDELMARKGVGEQPTGRRKVSHVRSETGDTLYIGTRKTGRKFFRFYDKSTDLGMERGRVWRVEIQYGRDLADLALETYQDIKNNEMGVINLVSAEFFDATGLTVIPGGDIGFEVVSSDVANLRTIEAKLDWLRRCVRPTISLLLNEDLQAEMMQALGLKPSGNWGKEGAKNKDQ